MAALVVQITHTRVLREILRRAIGNREKLFFLSRLGNLRRRRCTVVAYFRDRKRDKTGECCTKQCKNDIQYMDREASCKKNKTHPVLVAEVLVLVVGRGAVNLENKRKKIFFLFKKTRTFSTFPKNQYFLN